MCSDATSRRTRESGANWQTIDGAPKRRYQLWRNIANVHDMESAKALVTYNESLEPISIAGRWDKNMGTSEFLRYQPHGSIDAKAFSTARIREVLESLSMKPSIDGKRLRSR